MADASGWAYLQSGTDAIYPDLVVHRSAHAAADSNLRMPSPAASLQFSADGGYLAVGFSGLSFDGDIVDLKGPAAALVPKKPQVNLSDRYACTLDVLDTGQVLVADGRAHRLGVYAPSAAVSAAPTQTKPKGSPAGLWRGLATTKSRRSSSKDCTAI